jgi:GNAT superfamily N-acetyltransferase
LATIIYYGRDEIARRLNDGQKCIIAEYKGRIVHYSWLTSKDEYAGEIEKVIPVGAGERYLFNCRTLASARGRGIFPAVIARALDEAGNSGASHVITLVSTINRSSLRAFAKMAFSIREENTMTRLLVFRRYYTRSVKNHD